MVSYSGFLVGLLMKASHYGFLSGLLLGAFCRTSYWGSFRVSHSGFSLGFLVGASFSFFLRVFLNRASHQGFQLWLFIMVSQ